MLIAVTYSEQQEVAAGHPNNGSNLALVWVKSAHDLSKKLRPNLTRFWHRISAITAEFMGCCSDPVNISNAPLCALAVFPELAYSLRLISGVAR